MSIQSKFKEKLSETLKAVFPILGMLFFNVGVEMSMTPIGERTGSVITKSKNIFVVTLITFVMGLIFRIKERQLHKNVIQTADASEAFDDMDIIEL